MMMISTRMIVVIMIITRMIALMITVVTSASDGDFSNSKDNNINMDRGGSADSDDNVGGSVVVIEGYDNCLGRRDMVIVLIMD